MNQPQKLPKHIAIVMDGNRRWAKQQGWLAVRGHAEGATRSHDVVQECGRLGIEALTLYTFSTENWRRPSAEVMALMRLITRNLKSNQAELKEKNIQVRHMGLRQGLPDFLLRQIDATVNSTAHCSGMVLNLAINYGGRAELAAAFRRLAKKVQQGKKAVEEIDESTISSELYTAGLADPDLMIRTGGEMRISNFMPWQIAYAELWVTPVLWPQFSIEHLHQALKDYGCRDRRFGGVKE